MRTIVIIDVQRDFFDPCGALYVKGGEELPALIAAAAADYDRVVLSMDMHPANHCSFTEQGGPWPSHCVRDTEGAGLPNSFSPLLKAGALVWYKGCDASREEYGAFADLGDGELKDCLVGSESVDVCGIAGDYCVLQSAANLLKVIPSSRVVMLTGLIRSIDGGEALGRFIRENNLKTL